MVPAMDQKQQDIFKLINLKKLVSTITEFPNFYQRVTMFARGYDDFMSVEELTKLETVLNENHRLVKDRIKTSKKAIKEKGAANKK